MLDISKLKNRKTLVRLEEYDGSNEYILSLKERLDKEGPFVITPSVAEYVETNYNTEPINIDRIIDVTEYLGKILKEKFYLNHVPERVFVETVLGETSKSYHVRGKVFKNQKYSPLFYLPKTQVFENLMDVTIEVEVDFEKYEKLDKRGWELFKHQKEGVKFLLSKKRCILADDMGLGKVIANDIPVLTPNGWVDHGSLLVGDYVIGSDGHKTKVMGVYPNPLKKYYNITFTDGTIVESCDEHLWSVQSTSHKKRGNGFVVKPLKDIMNDLTYDTKNNLKWYIPIVKPVVFNSREITIDPYLLGSILGDGGISQNSIYLSTADTELIDECRTNLPKGYFFKKTKGKYDYRLNSGGVKNVIIKSLKSYDLMGTKSHNKFIPKDYLYNSIDVRLSILQGLLDTDGYCSVGGTIQYYSVSKQLSDDVKEIVRSLGGVARQTSKMGSYRLPDGTLKVCRESFILTIDLPKEIEPFRLERKKNRLPKIKKYNPSRGIKSVEFSRETYGQCISVEAEDSLYVMDKYVVTHNTIMSIVSSIEAKAEKILIVCPANAKINWFREINAFIDEDEISIISGKIWEPKKYTIINYDILKNFHTITDGRKTYEDGEISRALIEEKFDLIILDEAHSVKNPKANRTKIINEISKTIDRRWLLTGTPIANRPMDFFNLLKLCDSPVTSSWQYYAFRFCDGKKFRKKLKSGQYRDIWLTDGASNLEELHERTNKLVLRRLKDDHLDLPPKIVAPYYMEIDDMVQYGNVFEEYLEWAKSEGKRLGNGRHMVELIVLRKYLALEKVKQSVEIAAQAIDSGQKVIIFTNFTDSFNELMSVFGKLAVGHNGKMNATQKQNSIDEFQNNSKIKVFVGNLVSAGTAITLTEAEVIIMNDLDFVPANHAQAEDRAHRIGSESTTNVYYPIAVGTIDEMIYGMLQKKRGIINTVIGDESEEVDIIVDLIKEIKLGHKFS